MEKYFLQNNRIERWWVEQNKRVGYPLKYCLLDLEQRNLADRSIGHHLFSISEVTKVVAHYGTGIAVNAWNTHPIPSYNNSALKIQIICLSSFIRSRKACQLFIWQQGYSFAM